MPRARKILLPLVLLMVGGAMLYLFMFGEQPKADRSFYTTAAELFDATIGYYADWRHSNPGKEPEIVTLTILRDEGYLMKPTDDALRGVQVQFYDPARLSDADNFIEMRRSDVEATITKLGVITVKKR